MWEYELIGNEKKQISSHVTFLYCPHVKMSENLNENEKCNENENL